MRIIFAAVLLLGVVLAGAAVHMARGYVGEHAGGPRRRGARRERGRDGARP